MADGEGAEFQRKVILAFYTLLLIAGILIYWGWGLMYNTWYPFTRGNIGVYVIYIPLIAFGIIGILLYRKKKPSTA
jgi:multidrug resistance efflux pump